MPNIHIFLIMLIIFNVSIYISITSRLSLVDKVINQDYQGYQDFILRELTILDPQKWVKIGVYRIQQGKGLMLQTKGARPLDLKSIAHYVKVLVNKEDMNTLKMGVSTLMTP